MGIRNKDAFWSSRLGFLGLADRSRHKIATIANNTTVERGNGGQGSEVVVRYHGNWIATLHEDGSITLRDAGWRTVTTKERLNLLAPHGVRIWQENYVWYYSCGGNDNPREWDGEHRFTSDGDEWEETCPSCEVPYSDPLHDAVHSHSYDEHGHIVPAG